MFFLFGYLRADGFESDLAEYKGNISIGAGESLLCYRLPPLLKSFSAAAPKTKMFLKSMNCYDIRDEIISGTLDLGIFYGDVGGFGENIKTIPVGDFTMALVASPEIKKRYPDFITPNQNIPVPFIINEKNCIFRQIFEEYMRQKSIVTAHTVELWSIPTIKNLVKNNMGVSYLPAFTVSDELKKGELVEIETDIMDRKISAVCGYSANKWVSPAMKCFLDIMKKGG